jgi:hypothetical protein
MGIDLRDIRVRLQRRLWLLRLRAQLALLNLLRPIVTKLGSDTTQSQQFAAEWAVHDQEAGEQWKSLHRQQLFTNVGLALSQMAGMEDLLIAITCLLLRTHEANKVGTIMYSIISFPVWLNIVDDLFLLEPLYATLKPKWNKINNRLRGIREIRDRLAHHTIYYGDKATTLAGDTSLRPGQFDYRQKAQKYQPLDTDQISEFIDSVGKIIGDLRKLLEAMTDLLTRETSQKKSPEPTPGPEQG